MSAAMLPEWNRFAAWRALPGRVLLVVMVALLAAAALVPINSGKSSVRTTNAYDVLVKDEQQLPERGPRADQADREPDARRWHGAPDLADQQAVAGHRTAGRATSGVRIMKLKEGDKIAGIVIL